jgi:acyl-CoA thioesterase FadM
MIVFFRLALVIVKSWFKKRLGALDESIVTMRVWPNDLDLNMHMNSGRYISVADVGRINILCRAGVLGHVTRLGWRPLVGGSIIRYRRSLLPFQKFIIRSRVLCWDDKWFYFQHIIEKDGQLCFLAHVRGLLRGREGNIASSQFLKEVGAAGEVSPPIPEFIRLWNEAESAR